MNDLKQCPFCGSEAQLLIVPERVAHWVARCSKGCCNTCKYISDHDAEEAWNKRTAEEIVRCKECEYANRLTPHSNVYECASPNAREKIYFQFHASDWFCADGKRREK